MVRLWLHIVGLLVLASLLVGAQPNMPKAPEPLSGIINRYESVAEIFPCDSTIRMRSATSFRVGAEVVLIQMRGARIQESNDSAYGTILDMNGAGCIEFLVVGAVANDRITFTSTWVHPYDAMGSLQLVSVANVADAEVVKPVVALPWNGLIGGIVVIHSTGNVVLSADINVNGLGFHGGAPSFPRDVCSPKSWGSFYFYGDGGEKGAGIATILTDQVWASKGPFATGGGGGNGANAGGAGGSNAGMGGHGGDANTFCTIYRGQGGYPGQAVDSLLLKQRVYFGGGGGGGHQNDLQGTGGAAGGGIVVIKAQRIISGGGQILARGLSVRDTAAWAQNASLQPGDGAGGGGGGGSIVLDIASVSGQLDVDVRGGNGGLIGARYQPNGPGGGGGGGAVILTNVLPSLLSKLDGGMPGYHISAETADSVRNSPWGATRGQSGRVVDAFAWKKAVRKTLNTNGGGEICPGESITLQASPGFMLYKWSNGSTETSIRVGYPGTYSVEAIDSSGCRQTVGGMIVTLDPTQIDVPAILDFETVDFKKYYRRTLVISSLDDDTIVVNGVSNAASFKVADLAVFPAKIAPFGKLNVDIDFFSDEPRVYQEVVDVSVSNPCALVRTTEMRARVNPVRIHIYMPDTVARMGNVQMQLPIYATLQPDTADLSDTHLQLHVTFNSLMYAPRSVSRGTIVGDLLDLILNERRIIIDIDSLTIPTGTSVISRILGTVLLSGSKETPLKVVNVDWLRAYQFPIVTVEDGSLVVDQTCFTQGRLVRLLPSSTFVVGPNPARNEIILRTTFGAEGTYTFSVVNMQGVEMVRHSEIGRPDRVRSEFALRIGTEGWEQGAYVAQLQAPLGVQTTTFMIVR